MNKQRRKALNALQDRITAFKETQLAIITAMSAELEQVRDELEELRSAEQEGFDNLSEGLQASERGQAMEEAAGKMQEAHDTIDELVAAFATDELEASLDSAFEAIEEAKGEA